MYQVGINKGITHIYVIICTLHIAKQVYSDMLNFKNIVWHTFISA